MAVATVYRPWTISKILGVSPRTVNKCMDEGYLPFVHAMDGGGRCVCKADLIVFMQNYGFWDSMPAVSRYLLGLEPDMLCMQKEYPHEVA